MLTPPPALKTHLSGDHAHIETCKKKRKCLSNKQFNNVIFYSVGFDKMHYDVKFYPRAETSRSTFKAEIFSSNATCCLEIRACRAESTWFGGWDRRRFWGINVLMFRTKILASRCKNMHTLKMSVFTYLHCTHPVLDHRIPLIMSKSRWKTNELALKLYYLQY